MANFHLKTKVKAKILLTFKIRVDRYASSYVTEIDALKKFCSLSLLFPKKNLSDLHRLTFYYIYTNLDRKPKHKVRIA